MNSKKLIAVGITALAAFVAFADPTVTDVAAKQRYPWNGLVDITCKVTGIDGTGQCEFSMAAVMPDTGEARNVSQFWVVKNGVNSTDRKVQANGTYKLLWDAKAELGQVAYDNMVMRVNVVRFNDNHDMVQLWEGGPYWATTNIGAENPEDYGYYFWWGDTVGYKREGNAWVATDGSSSNFSFDSSNTPTYNKSMSIATLQSEGWITEDGVLAPAHDAAQVHWSGGWRMPTDAEFSALSSNCTTTWTTQNGVYGRLVTGKGTYANRSIFLPAAGYGDETGLDCLTSYGFYRSSTPDSASWLAAGDIRFCSDYFSPLSSHRHLGLSVRPVRGFSE